jgi:hypothetical protein
MKHGFHKVVCRSPKGTLCEADVFCLPKQSPRGLGDCLPYGYDVTAFGGSQRHNNLGLSMDFVKAVASETIRPQSCIKVSLEK